MDRIRLLVVEDQAMVREGLRALLGYRPEFEVVGTANNGREAVEQFKTLRPDVTLMDLQMPEMDGLSAIRSLRQIDAECRVLVLTTYEGDEDVFQALRAGAKGYLLKECPPEELFAAVRRVAVGGDYLAKAASENLAQRKDTGSLLSDREVEVLKLMAKGLSNREVADHLVISEATVRTHVGHIFTKLDVSDRLEAVMAAARRGILRL